MNRTRTLAVLFAIVNCAIRLNLATATERPSVEFPGRREPGEAHAAFANNALWLENDVLSAAWQTIGNSAPLPSFVVEKLSSISFEQTDRSLFRLATGPGQNPRIKSVAFAIAFDDNNIRILASRDGAAWNEVASLARSAYPGTPKLVRIGKMNMRAEAKSHSTDGPVGEATIFEIKPRPVALPDGVFHYKATAHEANTTEWPLEIGCHRVSCRIDKGTDQGETWAPAMALIWEEGKKFVAIGLRDIKNPAQPILNVFTPEGEQIQGVRLAEYVHFNISSNDFRVESAAKINSLAGEPDGVRLADRIAGKAIDCKLVKDLPHGNRLHAAWHAELRDGSNYIRQTVAFKAEKPTEIFGVEMIDLNNMPGMETIGRVPGCPVGGHGMFLGVEMPGAQNALGSDSVRIGFPCKLELSPEQSYSFSSVIGVAAPDQLRRSFLYYIERERARPSSPFLHYNGWYDAAPSGKHILNVVEAFDREMRQERGVPVQSYLVDDGWDNVGLGLWKEDNHEFPNGFAGLKEQMEKNGGRLGVWISPLGGYGGANERTAWAKKMKLIPEDAALDFSYPAYKQWFKERCNELMRQGGVNAFKWDRAGDGVSPHFMGLLDIAHDLRKVDPKVFINVTVGTWPSPFWLNHVDTTWRNGSGDVGWTGKGDNANAGYPKAATYNRQRWLTFRDGYCHELFVKASPLYPLNSVMHHGIVHGHAYQGGDMGRSNPPELKNEARSYFANGASLQELYLSYDMMTKEAWDEVAEAARWAHANADVLVDSHWVGGDPLKLQVYGYAAWNHRKGTLMLRNPDDRPHSFAFDIGKILELPADAPRDYELTSPYPDQRVPRLQCAADGTATIELRPFEVLVFDANAVKRP